MITSLLLVTFAAQSAQPPPLEDYLPGGPDRVQTNALEWLQRSQEWLGCQEGAEVVLEVTRDGKTERETHWLFRGRIAIASHDLKGGLGYDSKDLPVAYAAAVLRKNAWQRGVYGGFDPLIAWLNCPEAPQLAALSLAERSERGKDARLHWIRDGLRGTLDLSPNGAPLAWTWNGDGQWERIGSTQVKVLRWEPRMWDQAPPELAPALQEQELFFDLAAVNHKTRKPLLGKPASEATRLLLNQFGNSRSIHWTGTMSVHLGKDADSAIKLGEVQLDARLGWPAMGRLSMNGTIGPPNQQRKVHTEIVGNRHRYWHWDQRNNDLRPIPSLADLLSGMQGFLPLYAWAAREVPDTGWKASWVSEPLSLDESTRRWLSVIDGPTTSEFLIEDWSVLEARVFASESGNDAPVVHYRFDSLIPQNRTDLVAYANDASIIEDRLEEERARERKADPRSAELLPVGELAPTAANWSRQDGRTESLENMRGKPSVLTFWHRDPTGSSSALKAVSELQRKLDRAGDRSHFRAIALHEPSKEASTWLAEYRLSLPLGIGDSNLQRAFRARWLPTTYLIGADGAVLGRWLGTPGPELEIQLERLLRRDDQTSD
ncbi:MAG: TlpA family protein disulfide reductase [Planctomycetes bacterium]|nr:TlpA family protein disulfide reductase [Planctomycetota bacterium]